MKENNEMNTLLTNLTNVINDLHTCLGEMRDIIAREVDSGACSAPTDGEPCHGYRPKLWDDYVLLGHPHTDWPTYERNRCLAEASERMVPTDGTEVVRCYQTGDRLTHPSLRMTREQAAKGRHTIAEARERAAGPRLNMAMEPKRVK